LNFNTRREHATGQLAAEIGAEDIAFATMKGPFIPVTVLYMAGLVLGHVWAPPLVALFGAWYIALLGFALWPRRRSWLLGGALVLAGWTNLAVNTAILSPADLRTALGNEPQLGPVRGRLVATPTVRVSVLKGRETRRTSAVIAVEALCRDGPWHGATGRVIATMPGVLDAAFHGGRTVEVAGVLRPPSGPLAEGLFDYRAWLAGQGIYHELGSGGPDDWQLAGERASPPSPPWSDHFLRWAQGVLALGLPEEDAPVRLLWAMTLGWRTALTDEVSEPFVRTGTMHIFAISGLHIVLIAGILVTLLRVMQVPRSACGLLVVPWIWFYTAATGWQSSAIRATLMMSVVIVGWALRRPSDLANSLAAAGFLILLWDPRQLFQASFQLSFLVVLAIGLLAGPIGQRLRGWLAADPFLPEPLVPWWRRRLEGPLGALVVAAGTSTAAWIGSWPLIAHYFHVITPGGLVANLVIVPLSSLALMSNLGSLICGAWCSSLTELFNHSAWFWMTVLLRFSEWMAAQPGVAFNMRSPGLPALFAYYALLLGCVTPELRQRRRWIGTVALPGLVLALSLAGSWQAGRHTTVVTVLALRSGAALLVDAPGRKDDLLVDCGDETSAKAGVAPFLQAQGVNRLERLLVTHGDVRHVGGAELVDSRFRPRRITVSAAPSRSPSYRQLLRSLDRTPGRQEVASAGNSVAGWTVVHPAGSEKHPQADDNVLVLAGGFGALRPLLLGDLGTAGQAALLERRTDLRADIVVAGVPARGEPLSDALIAAIQPRLIVVQDGEYPASEQARPEWRRRFEDHGVPVLYATTDGTVTLRLKPDRGEVATMRGTNILLGQPSATTGARRARPLVSAGANLLPLEDLFQRLELAVLDHVHLGRFRRSVGTTVLGDEDDGQGGQGDAAEEQRDLGWQQPLPLPIDTPLERPDVTVDRRRRGASAVTQGSTAEVTQDIRAEVRLIAFRTKQIQVPVTRGTHVRRQRDRSAAFRTLDRAGLLRCRAHPGSGLRIHGLR